MIRLVHAHVMMMDFSIGEGVWFRTDLRRVEGVLVGYNKKSVTVGTDDGQYRPASSRKSKQRPHEPHLTDEEGRTRQINLGDRLRR
jgi:hypothetical protein